MADGSPDTPPVLGCFTSVGREGILAPLLCSGEISPVELPPALGLTTEERTGMRWSESGGGHKDACRDAGPLLWSQAGTIGGGKRLQENLRAPSSA